MSATPYHHKNLGKIGRLKELIKDEFNDLGNMLNGTYWKIKEQQDNVILYYAYELLAQRAHEEGNNELVKKILDKQAEMCYAPIISDPNYRGSRQEWLDLNDAQYRAKQIARSFAEQNPEIGAIFNEKWFEENHLEDMYEIEELTREYYEEKTGIALFPN